MTRPTAHPAPIAATAGVPPHPGSGPLTPAQLRIALARIACEPVALLEEALARTLQPPSRLRVFTR